MNNICDICNKKFKYNYLLIRHKNSKKSCANKITTKINKIKNNKDNIITEEIDNIKIIKKLHVLNNKIKINDNDINDFTCKYCNHTSTTKHNIKSHLKNCKERKKILNEIEDINNYKELKKLKENIIKEFKKMEDKTNINITNNNTNNTTTNNITNNTNNNLILNLNINSFGKEDLSYITDEEYINCLNQRFPGLFEFIKLVHLNKDAPQNHNIKHTNRRNDYIKIYKKGNFVTENKEEVLSDILNNNMGRLEDKAIELEENNKIDDKIMQNHNEFKKTYYENDKERINNTKKTTENMLLDNREITLNTQKLIK